MKRSEIHEGCIIKVKTKEQLLNDGFREKHNEHGSSVTDNSTYGTFYKSCGEYLLFGEEVVCDGFDEDGVGVACEKHGVDSFLSYECFELESEDIR